MVRSPRKACVRVYLAAARLIIEKNDRLVTLLAAAIRPHKRGAGGLPVLFLQDLSRPNFSTPGGLSGVRQ